MTPHNTPQPPPQPQTADLRQSAHWLVCSDLMDRAALGQAKYGVPLMTDNGRDHLTDAYQELLDLAAYLRCEIELRQQMPRMALDEMAAMLSWGGYLVYGPEQAMPERTWRRIGEKEGYLTSMSHVEMAELLKIAGYGIMPPPQGAEAPDPADDDAQACAQYPPLARTPYQPEHADMPTTLPEIPQISHNGTCEGIDTPAQQEEASAAATAPLSVLQHCLASEQRQGKTVVRQEILEELLRRGIPYMARWEDWSAEVARLYPGRWEV